MIAGPELVNGSTLLIVSRKYDGAFRFSTEVEVLHRSNSLVLGLGSPGRLVTRHSGEERADNWSLEYLPLNEPFNIVSFFDVHGNVRYHFCNAITPPELTGDTLSYCDLDLDVRVLPDGSYTVEDRDQFEHNSRSMRYPGALRRAALNAVDRLVALAVGGGHVFRCSRLETARARLLEIYAPHE